MNRVLGTYAAVMLALDALWLGVVAKPLYQQATGHLMGEHPRWTAAVSFYVVYAIGLTLSAVWPKAGASGWLQTPAKSCAPGSDAVRAFPTASARAAPGGA